MRFSQRIGKKSIKTILQVDSIDDDLKNRLWNVILEECFNQLSDYESYGAETEKGKFFKKIWKSFFKYPIDSIPTYSNAPTVYTQGFVMLFRKWFFEAQWFEIYDFIEFISTLDTSGSFTRICNLVLEQEVSAYRIVNEKIVQITSEEEVQEIEEASATSTHWKSVNLHLKTALDMLADRKNPDYRNSIKESISAVEALCIIITGDTSATLGRALAEIEKKHHLHGALKTAFSAIYGYTSDASGIRHALVEADINLKFEDAKFMLVACSAFINYLKSKMKI